MKPLKSFSCLIFTYLIFAPSVQGESLVESSMFSRIYLAYKVNPQAVQEWIPDPWKDVSAAKFR
jgi:hypothetical protein